MIDLPPQNMAQYEKAALRSDAMTSFTFFATVDGKGMSELEAVDAYAEKVRVQFFDGFQWRDIPAIVKHSIDLVGDIYEMSSKREFAIKIVDKVIDISDTPFLPDSLTDPLFKTLASSLINFTFDQLEKKSNVEPHLVLSIINSSGTPSNEELMVVAHQIQELFKDGFQWSDLTDMMVIAFDFLNEYIHLDEMQKKECVIQILNKVIDITDTPYLPDSLFDPLFKEVVPSFVDYMIKRQDPEISSGR